ncbi:FecR family protein [Sphingobacterium tabacisoli]|uniref:FecR family protein n=1 Tax=Sphingobacterium tabacisoli TaxID=2044855 RepID=A0ABW5L6X2_9SPHI|nr:FecR domain-containing protein [Sphingobacterium tabacisoli]
MKRTTGKELLKKLKEGTITTEERTLLDAWYDQYIAHAKPLEDIRVFVNDMKKLDEAFPFREPAAPTAFYKRPLFRIAAAAAIILLFLGVYLLRQQTTHSDQQQLTQSKVVPGSQGATLTLGNGHKINLNNLENGDIQQQAGIHISKSNDGQLTYTIAESELRNEIHTLSTAKGETYAVILPDKSKVWLNAGSSLTYNTAPVHEGQRKVTLQGEAYFEVSKDSQHPFIVISDNQQVRVLGTSFNINAYQEESTVTTTLLEGAVQLSTNYGDAVYTKVLAPDQQATVRQGKIHIQKIVASDAIAWKEGYFLFDSENLENVMHKIARWYNVSVIYDNPSLKKETMLGTISRYEQLSKVLDIIERTGIAHFEIKGREIHVKNK